MDAKKLLARAIRQAVIDELKARGLKGRVRVTYRKKHGTLDDWQAEKQRKGMPTY